MKKYKRYREFLKADLWIDWQNLKLDQREGKPYPSAQKPFSPDSPQIELIHPDSFTIGNTPLIIAIRDRQSHRSYTGSSITLEELSFLRWATQGVKKTVRDEQILMKTVPSAGARHPIETYLFVNNVLGLESGLYRYLGIEHKLLLLKINEDLVYDVHTGTNEQYVLNSAVVFIWTTIPYRAEWRYGPLAHKMIAQDSGHICQNLYLACASLGIGTCAIGAYDQNKLDQILGVDGESEFTIYVATVGKIST